MHYAAEIKSAVSMRDVLSHYGFLTNDRGRIACPIHGGKKPNFAYKDHSFKCWVCGASGTVLDFVMQYQGVDLIEAERILNEQFGLGLPIGREATRKERTELERKARLRRMERERRERQHNALLTAYNTSLDRWVALDKAIIKHTAQSDTDGLTEDYIYAIKHIDRAAYELDIAEIELMEFEKRG